MRRHVSALAAVVVLLLSYALCAATPGIFRGVVVAASQGNPGWIYLKGANGMLRRVEISRARVVYADSIPEAERRKMPESSITAGAELRVTADLDDRGEWRASRIEILSLHTSYDIPAASERLPWNRS